MLILYVFGIPALLASVLSWHSDRIKPAYYLRTTRREEELFAFYGKIYRNGRSVISAYTEVAGLLGNNDKSSGYPYWTLKERLYGGFGAGYTFGNLNKDINLSLDAAYFLDTFSDNFQRYRGSFSYPFDDKLYFTGSLEFYTLKNFYSNNFGVGLRYYLD